MKRLIVNADDFGLTDGVSGGIVATLLAGAVTATTAVVCVPGAPDRLARWAPRVPGRIGIHLQLTDGAPVCDPAAVPSLVTADGVFPRSWRELGPVDPAQVAREWHAQVEQLRGLGVQPTHVDTHHTVHLHPRVLPVYIEVARHHGLPARAGDPRVTRLLRARGVACADRRIGEWYGGTLTPARLAELVERAFAALGGAGTVELMCHPGHVDDELRRRSRYVEERAQELAALAAPETAERLARLGVERVGVEALAA